MYDYMKALHARFCREPELQKVRAELDQAYREIKARLGQQDQETLLQLADLENELREETSLTSFIAGFQSGYGDRRGDGTVLLRGRGRNAGHREGENEVSPRQRLICYTKKKSCRRQLFLNFLITVAFPSGYFFFLWYCVCR